MAYIKSKVNQSTWEVEPGLVVNGDQLNAAFLNHIQTQLQSFLNDYDQILKGWQLCFFKKSVVGTGNFIKVDGAIIGNPVIFINGIRYTVYESSEGPIRGTESFYYERFSDKIYTDIVAINGVGMDVYYYGAFPHNETHILGASDQLTVNDIGGLTTSQIDTIFSGGVTEETMTNLSIQVKEFNTYKLVIRSLSDGSGEPGEIYDIGLV